MTGNIAKKGLQGYMTQLQTHPLRTKALTAGVLSAVSDIVSQKLSGIQKLQIRRLLLKALFGCAYLGPFGHFFHLMLEKIFKGKKDTKTVAQKVVLEQLTSSPLNNLVFMLYYGMVVEGRPWPHVKSKIKADFPSVQLTAWTVSACVWVDKPPVCSSAVARALPDYACLCLGYLSELTSKNSGPSKTLSELQFTVHTELLSASAAYNCFMCEEVDVSC